jgi:magnesium chelatase family protein
MVCSVTSLGLAGVAGYPVAAECALSGGLPAFDVVGLPDAAVREARERVRAAVKSSGFDFPVSRITVNLAPADRRKGGTVYDLPILVGILCAGGQLSLKRERDSAFLGELSLDGRLRPVPGALPMALAAERAGAVPPRRQRPRGHPGGRPGGLSRPYGGRAGPPSGRGTPHPARPGLAG